MMEELMSEEEKIQNYLNPLLNEKKDIVFSDLDFVDQLVKRFNENKKNKHLKAEESKLKKEVTNLQNTCSDLTKERMALESELSSLQESCKQQKLAYENLIKIFTTYLQFKVSDRKSTDNVVEALITFQFAKNRMDPIKGIIDKENRTVLEIEGLYSKDSANQDFNPILIYYLRKNLLSSLQK